MGQMHNITIQKSDGKEQRLQFVGWTDDWRAFYAIGNAKVPLVVTPETDYPDDAESGERFRFGPVRPVSIRPFRIEPGSAAAKRFNVQWFEAINERGLIDWRHIAAYSYPRIRYAMACVDGDRFFLVDFDIRDHLTPKEAGEFRLLLEGARGGGRNQRDGSSRIAKGHRAMRRA